MKGTVTWFHTVKYQAALLAEHMNANYAKGINATAMAYNAHLPHEILVYPPKIYLPTLIIVTVGPLLSHREWNVLAAQPSTDARQQRFQRELTLFVIGASQLLNEVKWFLLFPTITESCKPGGKKFDFCYLTKELCWSQVELFKNSASNESFIKCNIASD